MSRQQKPTGSTSNSDSPKDQSSSSGGSPIDQRPDGSEQQSSPASPQPRISETSDGYPSWLPKRPPPPAPASTFHSSAPSEPFLMVGRKPTPRSVRIISMPDSRREPTDQTRVGNAPQARAWSRATGAGIPSNTFGPSSTLHVPKPKFRASALHLELLRSPSVWARLQFYLLPFFVFAHIPLQTFFDFNAVFIMLQ